MANWFSSALRLWQPNVIFLYTFTIWKNNQNSSTKYPPYLVRTTVRFQSQSLGGESQVEFFFLCVKMSASALQI